MMASTLGKQIIEGICCLITAAVYSVRFYLRIIIVRKYIWIEIPLLFAFCLQIALFGVHIKNLELLPAKNKQNIILYGQLTLVGAYLYMGALWAVKVSVNMLHIRVTNKFPRLNVWAVRSLYIVVCCWIFVMATIPFGCFPPSRKWNGLVGEEKVCPNIARQWDFWIHLSMHIITDIWLCILPFPALAQIKERRLRFAVYGVYSIAFCSVIVSIARASLLSINARNNAHAIMILSMIEVTTVIVVGALPCISSVFMTKFVNGCNRDTYSLGPVNASGCRHNRSNFSQLHDEGGGIENDRNNSGSFSESPTTIVIGQAGDTSRFQSTENIIEPHSIKKVTVVTIES